MPETVYPSIDNIKKQAGSKSCGSCLTILVLIPHFIKNLFRTNDVDVTTITKALKILVNIPVSSKEDLQKRNDDFLCVGQR